MGTTADGQVTDEADTSTTEEQTASTGGDSETTDRPRWECALYGGLLGTVSLPLFPVSLATGGALAGYLREGSTVEGLVVGGMAGLIPTVLFTAAALWFVDSEDWRIGVDPGGAFTSFDALYIGLVLLIFIPIIFAIFGAVGGALGVHVSEDL